MKALYETLKNSVLGGFSVTACDTQLTEYTETASGDTIVCNFTPAGSVKKLTLTAKLGVDTAVMYIDAECADGFAPKDAITMNLGDMKPDALLGSHHDCEWWMYPTFMSDFSELTPKTQSLFIKSGDVSYHLLPLCGDNFRCEFEAGKLRISSGKSGLTKLHGEFLTAAADADPFICVDKNFKFARSVGAIRRRQVDHH